VIRWDISIISSVVISVGNHFPLHNGKDEPQPSPDSVFETRVPPSKSQSMPIGEQMARTFSRCCKEFTFFEIFSGFIVPNKQKCDKCFTFVQLKYETYPMKNKLLKNNYQTLKR